MRVRTELEWVDSDEANAEGLIFLNINLAPIGDAVACRHGVYLNGNWRVVVSSELDDAVAVADALGMSTDEFLELSGVAS